MRNILVNGYLMAGAFMDGKNKKLSMSYLWIGLVLGLGFLILDMEQGNMSLEQGMLRLLPGILFLLYGKITGEKIGYGDGFMLIILGGCLTYPKLWYVWCVALFLIVFWAGYLLCVRKAGKNTRIPFLPFLWIADLLVWGMSYV